jgi:hypothetical protein
VRLTTLPCKKLLRSLQEIQPFLMEEDCGGGQGLSWAVEPRKEEYPASAMTATSPACLIDSDPITIIRGGRREGEAISLQDED